MEFHLYYMLAQQILFFSIQLFCLVAVLRALKQSGPGERVSEREEESHIKRRAFYVILINYCDHGCHVYSLYYCMDP